MELRKRVWPHLCLAGLLTLSAADISFAQGGRNKQPNVKTLDNAAEKAQSEYLKNLADLAGQYEEAGDITKASEMLKGILKVKPDIEQVKNKLKMFDEAVFKENVQMVDLDPGAGWMPVGVMVAKDKPIRIEAEGNFKFTLSDSLTPNGYQKGDLIHGVQEGIPYGGLMGVVGKAGDTSKGQKDPKDLPTPIFVGTQKEFVPTESGPLLLRVNLPAGAKCTGKIKVRISGNIAPFSR
ncbi:hypothetical protein SH668x_000380 [Planctomicrobium sp. SH668]|uniref:hypothetical protein n=1 Tax=Planctomicrobium sp. SH668 TaxID=3448126 RepID=UPI003F5C64C2